MAKASEHNTSIWLPAGAEPPDGTPDSVRLTGPGGAAAEQRRKAARPAAEPAEPAEPPARPEAEAPAEEEPAAPSPPGRRRQRPQGGGRT